MRVEFVPKVKATIQDIDIQSLKRGQTEVDPAVCIHLKITQANHTLAMLDKTLLPFLYQKGMDHSTQQALDGIPVVSDYPSLSPAAMALGALTWDDEQSGSKLVIYQGVTGDMDITLHDCTVRKVKVDPKEGGAVEWSLQVWTSDVDQDTLGALAVLKSLEREIELVAADVAQADLDEGKEHTPEKALAGAVGG